VWIPCGCEPIQVKRVCLGVEPFQHLGGVAEKKRQGEAPLFEVQAMKSRQQQWVAREQFAGHCAELGKPCMNTLEAAPRKRMFLD
jgi:hypothetical protein